MVEGGFLHGREMYVHSLFWRVSWQDQSNRVHLKCCNFAAPNLHVAGRPRSTHSSEGLSLRQPVGRRLWRGCFRLTRTALRNCQKSTSTAAPPRPTERPMTSRVLEILCLSSTSATNDCRVCLNTSARTGSSKPRWGPVEVALPFGLWPWTLGDQQRQRQDRKRRACDAGDGEWWVESKARHAGHRRRKGGSIDLPTTHDGDDLPRHLVLHPV